MADVRTVFRGLWILAAISVVILVAASRRRDRAADLARGPGGALGLTIGVDGRRRRSDSSPSTSCSSSSTRSSSRPGRTSSTRRRTASSSSSRSSSGTRPRWSSGVVDHRVSRSASRSWPAGGRTRSAAPRTRAGPRAGRGARDRERARSRPACSASRQARDAVLAVAEPVGTERVAGRRTRSVASPRRPSRPASRSRPGRTRRWTATRSVAADTVAATEDAPIELEVIGDIAAGAAPDVTVVRRDGGPHRDGRPAPGRRGCGRPGRGDDAARRGAPAGPRGRDATGPLPAACLVHEPVEPGGSVRASGQRPDGRRHAARDRDGA